MINNSSSPAGSRSSSNSSFLIVANKIKCIKYPLPGYTGMHKKRVAAKILPLFLKNYKALLLFKVAVSKLYISFGRLYAQFHTRRGLFQAERHFVAFAVFHFLVIGV